MMRFSKILIIIIFTALTSSCVKDKKESAATLYLDAHQLLKDKDYITAAETFEKIIDEYPFSKWGVDGQIMSVYARYKDDDYVNMVSNIDNFISLNPANEYIDYMFYMKGIAYYDQIPNIYRAQNISQESLLIFNNLISRFPNSKYSADAKSKLSFITDHIAGSYMSKARFQYKQNNYIGAINNFLVVIDNYKNSNQTPEAYYRLAETYINLGATDLAKKSLKFLKENYDNSFWHKLAEKNLKSFTQDD